LREAAQRDTAVDNAWAADTGRPEEDDHAAVQRRVVQGWADFVGTQIDVARQTVTGSV
jgi:hypothetical protein